MFNPPRVPPSSLPPWGEVTERRRKGARVGGRDVEKVGEGGRGLGRRGRRMREGRQKEGRTWWYSSREKKEDEGESKQREEG
eukprot:6137303-Pyramimonas_sp.AAC.1